MLWAGMRGVGLLDIGSRRLNLGGVGLRHIGNRRFNLDGVGLFLCLGNRRLNQPPQCRLNLA
jgi:hypothetical protein